MFRDGISFLNNADRKNIKNIIGNDKNSIKQKLTMKEVEEVHRLLDSVKLWLTSSTVGQKTELTCRISNFTFNFVLKNEINWLTKDIWADLKGNKVLHF